MGWYRVILGGHCAVLEKSFQIITKVVPNLSQACLNSEEFLLLARDVLR